MSLVSEIQLKGTGNLTSESMIVGTNGVNITIAGMTGGTVYVERHDGTDWVQNTILTYTGNAEDYALFANGTKLRVTTAGLTSATVARINVNLVGGGR